MRFVYAKNAVGIASHCQLSVDYHGKWENMNFRYTIEIKKDGETIDYIQLFGDNDYIEPVHKFIREQFFADGENSERWTNEKI